MTERKCVKERNREASIPKQNIDRERERERSTIKIGPLYI